MSAPIHYYHVQTPEASMTFLGGPLQADGDHVWLTTPDGRPVVRVLAEHVTPSSPEECARRIAEDQRSHRL